MRVLLINPPWMHKAVYPPIGIAYLAAVLDNNKIDNELLECEANKISNEEVASVIRSGDYDIIGLTATTSSFEAAKKCAGIIRDIKKDLTIVLGGVHASSLPMETIKCKEFNIIVKGEGEETFLELVKQLRCNGDLSKVLGICYKDKFGNIFENVNRPPIADINSIPFPARSKLPNHKYLGAPAFPKVGNIATIVTTRGCPFPCTFCSAHAVWQRNVRMRSQQNILAEIDEVWNSYGTRIVMFKDDTFTLKKTRVYEVCNGIKNDFPDLIWSCSARVDSVDYEMLKTMKDAGCRLIEFGVESASLKVLNTIKKNINLEQAETSISNCKKLGITTNVYFMIGNPDENKEEILLTVEFAKRVNPDSAQFAITTPFPGSELYEQYKDSIGEVEDWSVFAHSNLSKPSDTKPAFQMSNVDRNFLGKIVADTSRHFLFKPERFIRTIKRIRTFKEFVTKLKAGLDLIKTGLK